MTALLQPTEALAPGQTYAANVNPADVSPPVADLSGNAATTVEVDFTEPAVVEQGSAAVSYGWTSVSSSKAFGNSYMVQRLAGATATFAFTGTTVTWYTVMGPSQGMAGVWIDGHPRGTFDQYAATMTF